MAVEFFFFEDLRNQSSRDAVILGDLGQAVAACPVPQDTLAIHLCRSTADADAFQLGATHAGPYSLDDQIAFEFGNRRDDDHHSAAEWAAGVELFATAHELDIEMIEFVEYFQEVPH